jgi:beta-galactosidase
VRSLSDTRHIVTVPKGSLDGIYDARLCITYEGDAAQLFLNGEMIADNFHNGEVWEIGLREFANKCLGKKLVLHIVPHKKGVRVLRDAMAAITESAAEQYARLVSVHVKAVCRKKVVL